MCRQNTFMALRKYLPLNKKGSRGSAPGFCATSTQHRAESYRLAASEAWRRAHCRGEMSAEGEMSALSGSRLEADDAFTSFRAELNLVLTA